MHLVGRGRPFGREILIVGLTLTFCAGLMAVSFWALYGDVNLGWWAPNIVLMIVPCVLYGKLLREDPQRESIGYGCGRLRRRSARPAPPGRPIAVNPPGRASPSP